MEDIDKAISTLQELSRCTDLDQGQKLKRKFEVLAGSTANESLDSVGMPSIYGLNEETRALVQKVEKLLSRGKFSEGIALDAFEEKTGDVLPTSKLAGETTAIRNMEEIYDFIKGDVRKIGVYGMGGIGKTTVMKHINNRLLKEKNEKFYKVIWVTVSKESSVFKLQHDISSKLKVNLSNDEDPITRAGKLFKTFQKMGRYLLILDDLWEAFDLENVGIPDPDDHSSSNGGKIVLTTRSLDVCRKMKCQPIKMNLLSDKEAWGLFLDHVGPDVLQVKYLEPIIRDVASECACLPLAIAIIATSMSGKKEACDWRDALAKLRAFSKEPDDEGKRVIKQLKFSYDNLKNKKLQKCLLLCALYPEDYYIDRRELVELLALEGIIEEKDSKRAEIDEGNAMLNKLINQCLLEGGKTWVKMHDLVRDMSLQIDGLHSQYKAISGNELRKLENVKWSENLLKIHVSNCVSLNASPVCHRLTIFILHDEFIRHIPDSFFQHLKALKILNLSGCRRLRELPNSISGLVNLVGLLLRDCCYVLTYVPSLAKLKNLLTLELSSSDLYVDSLSHLSYESGKLKRPPTIIIEGLKELTNLRYLNLFSLLYVLPRGILPELRNLRYLVCSHFNDVHVDELMKLENLEVFKGDFHDIQDLRTYVKHVEQKRPRLISYIFCVDLSNLYLHLSVNAYVDDSFDKVVRLGSCNVGDDGFLVPKDVQVFEIRDVHDITSLCDVLSLEYAGERELVSASSSSSFVLGSLERLDLKNLENLEALIGGKMEPCNIFPCLKELEIQSCPRIKVVFDIGLFSDLNNLEILKIHGCKDLTVIIRAWLDDKEGVKQSMADISLPKLRHLRLMDLQQLRSICPASRRLICRSLREMTIINCPQLEQCVYVPSEDDKSSSASLRPIELKRNHYIWSSN